MSRKHLSSLVLLPLCVSLITGCGDRSSGQDSAGETNGGTGIQAPAQAEESTADRQQKLADAAIALITRVADAIVTITDLDTAKAAAANIATIDTEFLTLAKKMEAAGQPAPALVSKFREAHKQASDAMSARIGTTMPKLTDNPEIMELLNETFKNFGKTLSHPSFSNYGVDGKG